MSKDFIHNNILQGVADAIRYCDGTTAGIAPSDFADRIRALDKFKPDFDVLNFYMPNGGTISLNKTGSPTVVELEYWLDDNGRWIIWQPDNNGNRSLALSAGQCMYVRNKSVVSTGFSTSTDDYYYFEFSSDTYANGNTNSLLCKHPNNAELSDFCFIRLYQQCRNLLSPSLLPQTRLFRYCYNRMYYNCINLIKIPLLPAENVIYGAYYYMFYGCIKINEIKILAKSLEQNSLTGWVTSVSATGDFYCPAELTIPTGTSGIPSGWTRHDI